MLVCNFSRAIPRLTHRIWQSRSRIPDSLRRFRANHFDQLGSGYGAHQSVIPEHPAVSQRYKPLTGRNLDNLGIQFQFALI